VCAVNTDTYLGEKFCVISHRPKIQRSIDTDGAGAHGIGNVVGGQQQLTPKSVAIGILRGGVHVEQPGIAGISGVNVEIAEIGIAQGVAVPAGRPCDGLLSQPIFQ